MAGVMVVWANLPDEALDWYENEYIPEMTALHSTSTLHCDLTTTGLEAEPLGHLNAPWELMAIYEVPDVGKMAEKSYDKANHPTYKAGHLLENARFDVTMYREIQRGGGGQDWDGDMTQVASVTATEWRVTGKDQEEAFKFYTECIAPTIASGEESLRFRLFQVHNATVLTDGMYTTKDTDSVHTYFALLELSSDDWPWERILQLTELDQWKKHWETQDSVKWQTSHYLVQRLYPDCDPGSPDGREENSDTDT